VEPRNRHLRCGPVAHRHAHDDRKPDSERTAADGLDQRRDPAREQIGVDQHRDPIFGKMKRAAKDQRHRNGIGVHREDVLQAERKQLG
jgi:hypothetical protein